MSYCLNPNCPKPTTHQAGAKFCQNCGKKLLLNDRYRAIKLIGQGGFGRTFLATDEYKPLKPPCVIKQFFMEAVGTKTPQKAIELFEQEAVRLNELGKHSQIPELFAYFEQDDRLYIIQEWIEGPTLAQELEKNGRFSEEKILNLLNDLLPLLAFIHQEKVIHRDIKPENIIRRVSDQKLVLVDFGAAKSAAKTVLGFGTIIGSAGYAAPEQMVGKPVFASDIYSLGVTCLHLLTQQEPEKLHDVSNGAFLWRHFLSPPLSNELANILDKMAQDFLNRRYKTATEVVQALSTLKHPAFPPNASIKSPLSPVKFLLKKTLTGHSDYVLCVVFSPDGKTLASSSGYWDKTIKLWDIVTLQEKATLKGHSDGVRCIAFSLNGKLLASGSKDNTIKLWDLASGQEKHTLKGHTNGIFSLAFSPDGKILATGSADKTIKLWNVDSGQEKNTLKGHKDCIFSIKFSRDGQHLVSCSGYWDQVINLWNINSGTLQQTLKGHSDGIRSLAVSPNGKILASSSGSVDKTIKLWKMPSGDLQKTLEGHSDTIFSVVFSPDGQYLLSGAGTTDKTLKIWDIYSGQEILTLQEHTSGIQSVDWSPDGKLLASGSEDNTIKIWCLTPI